jgi:hypothetical protein
MAKAERRPVESQGAGRARVILVVVGLGRGAAAAASRRPPAAREARAAWGAHRPRRWASSSASPSSPLGWSVWESLHAHDLRLAWSGRPFIGLDNYLEAFGEPRFRAALGADALLHVSVH